MKQIFPKFDIDISTMLERVKTGLEDSMIEFEKQMNVVSPDWNTLDKFEAMQSKTSRFLSEISHLNSVNHNQLMVEEYNKLIPILTQNSAYISQNEDYYNFLNRIDKTKLNETQLRVLKRSLDVFKSSGFGLSKSEREHLNNISERLSFLSQDFMENVNSSIMNWSYTINEIDDLKGLNENVIDRLYSNEIDGCRLTLISDYGLVMSDLDNREIRKHFYYAQNQLASSINPKTDNTDNISEILKLRHMKATLLGYKNYAEYSLRNKMADNVDDTISFLEDIADRSSPKFLEDFEEISEFAKEIGIEKLELWDYSYVIKKYQERKHKIDISAVSNYFPLEKVLSGLVTFINEMFGYQLTEIDVPYSYHDDLRLFKISKDGEDVSYIYYDLFARKGKKPGAWMSDHLGNNTDSLPVSFVVCNFSDTLNKLLSLDNVSTLFHEFGHALHHSLSKVEESSCFGISGVAWDVVELPSTFMEFFVLDPKVLKNISSHCDTGEPLPLETAKALKAMEVCMSSFQMLRQMELSIVDLKAHTGTGVSIDDISKEYRKKYGMQEIPEGLSLYNQFSHIFAGGYAAGYYSYKWANILSSDIYESFEAVGGVNRELGQKYLDEILSKGSSKDMADLFFNFKGREPNNKAFLRHSGIKVHK